MRFRTAKSFGWSPENCQWTGPGNKGLTGPFCTKEEPGRRCTGLFEFHSIVKPVIIYVWAFYLIQVVAIAILKKTRNLRFHAIHRHHRGCPPHSGWISLCLLPLFSG